MATRTRRRSALETAASLLGSLVIVVIAMIIERRWPQAVIPLVVALCSATAIFAVIGWDRRRRRRP